MNKKIKKLSLFVFIVTLAAAFTGSAFAAGPFNGDAVWSSAGDLWPIDANWDTDYPSGPDATAAFPGPSAQNPTVDTADIELKGFVNNSDDLRVSFGSMNWLLLNDGRIGTTGDLTFGDNGFGTLAVRGGLDVDVSADKTVKIDIPVSADGGTITKIGSGSLEIATTTTVSADFDVRAGVVNTSADVLGINVAAGAEFVTDRPLTVSANRLTGKGTFVAGVTADTDWTLEGTVDGAVSVEGAALAISGAHPSLDLTVDAASSLGIVMASPDAALEVNGFYAAKFALAVDSGEVTKAGIGRGDRFVLISADNFPGTLSPSDIAFDPAFTASFDIEVDTAAGTITAVSLFEHVVPNEEFINGHLDRARFEGGINYFRFMSNAWRWVDDIELPSDSSELELRAYFIERDSPTDPWRMMDTPVEIDAYMIKGDRVESDFVTIVEKDIYSDKEDIEVLDGRAVITFKASEVDDGHSIFPSGAYTVALFDAADMDVDFPDDYIVDSILPVYALSVGEEHTGSSNCDAGFGAGALLLALAIGIARPPRRRAERK